MYTRVVYRPHAISARPPLFSFCTQNRFSSLCYQVVFCTELISTGATHAIQLGFARIAYPPGQYNLRIQV
jgi:hypothetical protein